MVCVEAHIIKTVQIYPEDPLFHHMKSAICLSCCHRAAYSQPTVNYFISLVCFPVRKEQQLFVRVKRTFCGHSDVKRGGCLNITTYFRVQVCFIVFIRIFVFLSVLLHKLCTDVEFYFILSFIQKWNKKIKWRKKFSVFLKVKTYGGSVENM